MIASLEFFRFDIHFEVRHEGAIDVAGSHHHDGRDHVEYHFVRIPLTPALKALC